jgi:hypothetical protein
VPEVAPEVVASASRPKRRSASAWSPRARSTGRAWSTSTSAPTTTRNPAPARTEPGRTGRRGAHRGIDIDLDLSSADPAEPSRGPQLFDHVKLGFAYQMHLKDEWQKVRLTHVSAARSFFVFTRGKQAPGDDLDDRAHARAHVRDRPHARRREHLPDGARDAARAQAARGAGRRRPGTDFSRSGARRRAMRSAARRLLASARPVPAMSNAVPWSGLVRTNGRPSVTFTPCSTPRYLTGIRPWSCVIATTMSNSPGMPGALRARMNTVSGANGPLASMPSARAARSPGR